MTASAYQAVPQEERARRPPTHQSPSLSSTAARPEIYFNDGPFSPPSSPDSLVGEKPRSHGFLDEDADEVYRDEPSSPGSYIESGVRRPQKVVISYKPTS